jgi:hypothetical protein
MAFATPLHDTVPVDDEIDNNMVSGGLSPRNAGLSMTHPDLENRLNGADAC